MYYNGLKMLSHNAIYNFVNTNRNFIGMELDENYFKIAKERIECELNNVPYIKNDIDTNTKNEKVILF